ncbi:trihelix transcription factor PTL-like [Gastrolobium bilobum]|uniref:trihelix transcription factor PTL-like n=1 Tax=Gastrolobium bilobum TaxID=150636 RepID=UPI002AB1DC8A|nr:trihelix transcription factor PTL-like [Gastrolobium bilobum]
MEMEDHHHHHHNHNHNHHHQQQQQQQLQQYGMTDLRQLVNEPRSSTATHFPPVQAQPTAEVFSGHRNLTTLATSHHQHQHYEMMMMFGRDIMPRGLHDFASTDSAAAANITSASTPSLSGLEAETAGCIGGDASTGRWPRQETLTLLEIRSKLDPKFKEANQKGPLWDEVSRIMSEEHGYQRSGKKCREKFENLYKYYKKTKEGKAGRHDGKHYRFFRQLEALYGENSNQTSVPETNNLVTNLHFQTNQEKFQSQKHCDSLSLTNSTEFGTSSSDDDNDQSIHEGLMENHDDSMEKRKKKKNGKSWKVKIKNFIDSQMRKLVEKQEEWLDKLVKTLEEKEKERMLREEEWRKQEATRLEREHKFWAKERAWIEARDAALMEALQNLTGRELKAEEAPESVMIAEIRNQSENQNEDGSEILNSTIRGSDISWSESEITRLQQLKAEMETRFPQSECSEEIAWEEVANKMACFGYKRTALMYKEKWESISNYQRDAKEGNKKRKENSRNCFYFKNNDIQSSLYNQGSSYGDINDRLLTHDGSSPSNSNVGNVAAVAESCFPFLMSTEEGNLWENYGLKLNKANQNH